MSKSKDYQERFYRKWVQESDLISNEAIIGETDILFLSENDISEISEKIVKRYRGEIEGYIGLHPEFKESLEPLPVDSLAPPIIKDMMNASCLAGVGPMASVAGAIAEFAGKELLSYTSQIIVENGGDIFIKSDIERRVAIFSGEKSPFKNRLFIKVRPDQTPLGVCTSSGTVGHSLSFGNADACVIISKSAALADAAATAACNKVKDKGDIRPALDFALSINGVKGALILIGKDFGILGDIELA